MTQPKISKKLLLIILTVVVLVIAVVLLGSGVDRDQLQKQVDAFAESLHDSAEKHGRDITFTYREITVEGWIANRHGVIHDPKIVSKPLNGDAKDSLVITTPIAEIYPKSADLSAIELQLSQPLEFTTEDAPEKKLLTIKANAPLTWQFAQTQENKVDYLDVTHPVATRLELTYLREQQAHGVEDETPQLVPIYKDLIITAAEGGSIRSHISNDERKLGTMVVDVRDVHLFPKDVPNGAMIIAEISIQASNAINDKNRQISSVKLHCGDLSASPSMIPYMPISLRVDASYDRAAGGDSVASDASIKLTEFMLSTLKSKLSAQADFTAHANDFMPQGTANITLTNLPYVLKELRNRAAIEEKDEAFITPIVEKISGQKLAEIADLVVDINRPQGGSFTIGKSTFEELFALALSGAMKQAKPQPPAAPAIEGKPAKKGAMVVEDSARG